MILLVVEGKEGKERKGKERGFVFVWYGFVREREREENKRKI